MPLPFTNVQCESGFSFREHKASKKGKEKKKGVTARDPMPTIRYHPSTNVNPLLKADLGCPGDK